ncbi:armadillo-type protein [Limtongia smithiae]|uniref:armadillo-type protein n=1 Tax=Limtongia smithiae TaxID=1125753 RepID=UPI0034CEB163
MIVMQSIGSLQFKHPLAPRAGKPIAVTEQLKRLKSVHDELQQFEQGMVDLMSIDKVAKELISDNLLRTKDKGVKAYVACCLADILRLFAPDAPYTVPQLQAIFEFFVTQLKGLTDTESPYFSQYCYLLESLSQVKSIVLVADLPNGEDIMTSLFRMFFDMVKPDSLKNLEFHMGEVLVQLVEEVPTIPVEVVEMILAQFLRVTNSAPTQTKKWTRATEKQSKVQTQISQAPPAYNMAKTICINCSDRMARQISQYFTDVIYNTSTKSGDDEISEEDMTDLKKAHSLIVEIWRSVPEVLQTVIPQLEQEILVENVEMRVLATETVGLIAGQIPGRVNFISSQPACWEAWMGRQNDRSGVVRAKWAEGCAYIIGSRSDVVKGTVEGLAKSLIDNEDRVRLSTCKAIGTLSYKTIIRKFRNEEILNNLAERSRDRKYTVRAEAIEVLGSLYDYAYEDISNQDQDVIAQLSWIPSRIFDLYYLSAKDTNLLLDYCLNEQLLPLEIDDKKRVQRLLTVVKYLDDKAKKAFAAVPARQQKMSAVVSAFIQLCEKNNGGVVEEDEEQLKTKIKNIVRWLSEQFPDASKAEANLMKFALLNDRRLYKAIKDCINSASEYGTIVKAFKELNSRLKPVSTVLETIMPIMYRSSALWYNRSNVLAILEISKDVSNPLSSCAHELLKDIASNVPAVLVAHIRDLTQQIQKSEPGFEGSVDTLKTCAEFAQKYPDELPQERQFLDALMQFATAGSAGEAKHAASMLLHTKRKHTYARDLLGACMTNDVNDEHFLAHLASIGELVLETPAIVEPEIDNIISFLIKEVLMRNRVKPSDDEKDWVEDSALEDDCHAKVLALRILVNRLRSAANADSAQEIAKPVLNLLNTLVVNAGEISKKKDTPAHFTSRLRLSAGLFLLKLARLPVYERLISPKDINSLSLLVQDTNFQVRQAFIDKLKMYLAREQLPEKYIPIMFLMAYEPEDEVKDELVMWIRARLAKQNQQKGTVLENCFPRLLHLLAHHPDYGTNVDDLLDSAQYLIFYMNTVVTEQNISLIFYFAQRVKQVRDALPDDTSERLYYLSDLAQAVIRQFEDAHGWSMQTWPGKAPLPSDLFKALPSATVAQKIARTTYIPDGVVEKLPGLVKVRTSARTRS